MVVQEGFDRLSMHKLAKAAGISAGTIYIYFKDREDMLQQISVREEQRMFDASLESFDPEMDFETGMRTQWHNRARYFIQNPNRLLFMEQMRYSRFSEAVHQCNRSVFIQTMTRFVARAIDRRQLVPLPLEVFWSVAFAPLYQLIKFHITGRGMHQRPFSLENQTLEQALQLVIKGLQPRD